MLYPSALCNRLLITIENSEWNIVALIFNLRQGFYFIQWNYAQLQLIQFIHFIYPLNSLFELNMYLQNTGRLGALQGVLQEQNNQPKATIWRCPGRHSINWAGPAGCPAACTPHRHQHCLRHCADGNRAGVLLLRPAGATAQETSEPWWPAGLWYLWEGIHRDSDAEQHAKQQQFRTGAASKLQLEPRKCPVTALEPPWNMTSVLMVDGLWSVSDD